MGRAWRAGTAMAYDPYGWRPYVRVAQRRARAGRELARLRAAGVDIQPVEPRRGRKLATSFWGEAWCEHVEKFSDFASRLPRGRTYVRNGSVCHLDVREGEVQAIVSGSDLYNVEIRIDPLPQRRWRAVQRKCAGRIGSLLELLSGRLDASVMEVVTDRDAGLFPSPAEIHLACDCPDWAKLCKHAAAVLYGVGARLDARPELLFVLRGVDREELIQVAPGALARAGANGGKGRRLAHADLSQVFGVEIEQAPVPPSPKRKPKPKPKPKKAQAKRASAATSRRAKQEPIRPTGRTVAALRESLGLNKSQLARLLGVSPVSISNWERARGRLKLQERCLRSLMTAIELATDPGERTR